MKFSRCIICIKTFNIMKIIIAKKNFPKRKKNFVLEITKKRILLKELNMSRTTSFVVKRKSIIYKQKPIINAIEKCFQCRKLLVRSQYGKFSSKDGLYWRSFPINFSHSLFLLLQQFSAFLTCSSFIQFRLFHLFQHFGCCFQTRAASYKPNQASKIMMKRNNLWFAHEIE